MARLCTNHGFTEFRSDNRTGLSYLLSDAAFRALDALLVLLHEELELLNAHFVAVVPVQRSKIRMSPYDSRLALATQTLHAIFQMVHAVK